MGAVTTERTPVPGCRVQPLGVMRYLPVASADFVKRYLPAGFTVDAVGSAPSLAWNRDDALQDMLVRKVFRRVIDRPVNYVPTSEGFGAAVHAGLGWGGMYRSSPPLQPSPTVRSSKSAMPTWMFRCSGSAGNSTAH